MKAIVKKIDFRRFPAVVSSGEALSLEEAHGVLRKLRKTRAAGDPVVHGIVQLADEA